MEATTNPADQVHPNSFRALYEAEIASFTDQGLTPGAAEVFAVYNVAKATGISYWAAKRAAAYLA